MHTSLTPASERHIRTPFLQDLLTSGLPSARTQTGREPALKLHPIRRVFNASSLQFEFKCDASRKRCLTVQLCCNGVAPAARALALRACYSRCLAPLSCTMGASDARSSSTALESNNESNNQTQKKPCTCRYGTDFGVVPTLITHSQDDWFRPEQYTYERLLSLIGERPVRYPEKECAPGSDKRDSSGCHSIKEANLALIGKEWAALEPSNLTAVGVETYSDFMKVQVCVHIHRKALTKPGGIVRPVRGAIPYAFMHTAWLFASASVLMTWQRRPRQTCCAAVLSADALCYCSIACLQQRGQQKD